MWKQDSRRKKSAGISFCFGSALGILLLSGCGTDGPERVPVSGKVTFQGQPVKLGEMRFFPIEGTIASMTGAQIKDGLYEVAHRGGVQVGTHKVEILAFEIKADKPSSGEEKVYGGPARRQYLPEKYHKKTELKLTIESGSGHVTHDFELE